MKTLLLTFTLLFSLSFSLAQNNEEGQTLTISINNISNSNGHVIVSLHTADTFMKGGGIKTVESKIIDGKITATFYNVTPGIYAVMALHDANDSKSMDFNNEGRPTESYGMSNNPIKMGPPQFNDAKFEVKDKDIDLNIIF